VSGNKTGVRVGACMEKEIISCVVSRKKGGVHPAGEELPLYSMSEGTETRAPKRKSVLRKRGELSFLPASPGGELSARWGNAHRHNEKREGSGSRAGSPEREKSLFSPRRKGIRRRGSFPTIRRQDCCGFSSPKEEDGKTSHCRRKSLSLSKIGGNRRKRSFVLALRKKRGRSSPFYLKVSEKGGENGLCLCEQDFAE